MNIRKELLQELYDIVINNDLYPELSNAYSDALDKSNLLLGEDTKDGDKMTASIAMLAYKGFVAGGAAVLDFISGKEVQ